VIFSLSLIVALSISYYTSELVEAGKSLTSCNCVVFRIDDIQDVFVDEAQIAAMNLFISKDQPLSLGLIMNEIGNDLRITGKVGEGSQKGLFELGLHGCDHVDYTKLSESEQESSLQDANEKMKKIFGNTSDIFIEPYGYFNNDIIKAMERLGIRISSAALFSENNFNQGRNIFNYTDEKLIGPQDFMYTDENGRIESNNAINQTEFQEFIKLVDEITSRNIRITTLSEIVGIEPKTYSYFR
jgi:peptidoglycan/xylan/chitin deacetylase (PgdA/CDA1 family)